MEEGCEGALQVVDVASVGELPEDEKYSASVTPCAGLLRQCRFGTHSHFAQVQDRVADQLAGPVVGDEPTAFRHYIVCPHRRQTFLLCDLRRRGRVLAAGGVGGLRTSSAFCVNGRVLQEQHDLW